MRDRGTAEREWARQHAVRDLRGAMVEAMYELLPGVYGAMVPVHLDEETRCCVFDEFLIRADLARVQEDESLVESTKDLVLD